jgi:glyoxylase-like metal-dependent hydrolase (beta-lactamase superfamily II)
VAVSHLWTPCASHNARMHSDTTELGDDVFLMDTRMGGYDQVTSAYLIRSSRPCLVETGAANSAETVMAQMHALGIGANDLATVVVTHIHLDHAGGVGDFAKAFPNAQIVVHERGARHLADPSRLLASAHRIFGEAMDRLFGDLLPTPADRIVALGDIGSIDLGDGRRLDAFHNPGHASHHVGLIDSDTGDLYTGDAAGVYVPETQDVRPATPPPEFDLALAISSLHAMRERQPTRLLFSHYGPVSAVDETLQASEAELHAWVETVREVRGVSDDLEHAIAMVAERTRARYPRIYEHEPLAKKQEELSGVVANLNGVWRWLEKEQQQA